MPCFAGHGFFAMGLWVLGVAKVVFYRANTAFIDGMRMGLWLNNLPISKEGNGHCAHLPDLVRASAQRWHCSTSAVPANRLTD
jgi:hypothetical protein